MRVPRPRAAAGGPCTAPRPRLYVVFFAPSSAPRRARSTPANGVRALPVGKLQQRAGRLRRPAPIFSRNTRC